MKLKLVGEGTGIARYCPTFSNVFSKFKELTERTEQKMMEMRVQRLVKDLRDANSFVRENAANALGKAANKGADISIALPALVKCSGDNIFLVQLSAAGVLVGAAAKEKTREVTLGILVDSLGDENSYARKGAAWALRSATEKGDRKMLELIIIKINKLAGSWKFAAGAEMNSEWYIDVAEKTGEIMQVVQTRMKEAA